MNDNTVRGPMYVDATPLMVTADVTPLVEANAGEMLDLLCEEFFDDFIEIATAEPTGVHDGHAPEKLAFEQLRARLVERMSTRVALTGPQAMRVAGQMARLGRPLAEEEEHKKAVAARCEALLIAAARRHG